MTAQNWTSLINFDRVPNGMISGKTGNEVEDIARESMSVFSLDDDNQIADEIYSELERLEKEQESQYPMIDEYITTEMNKHENESIPKSTVFSTKTHVARFKKFLDEKSLSNNIETIPESILADYLRYYYFSLRTKDGRFYSPSSLIGIRAAIHRYLTGSSINRKINILHDEAFRRANGTLKAMVGCWLKNSEKLENKYVAIELSDLEKLKTFFNASTPTILQQQVWFYITYFFGLRGRETLPQLKKNCLSFTIDSDGREYAYLNHNVLSKNVKASLDMKENENVKKCRIYDNTSSDEMCPVSVLKTYLAKIPTENPSLFPLPMKNWNEKNWYCKKRFLGKASFGDMMKNISENAGLSKIYTNHCVRVTVVTQLKSNGWSSEDVCLVTGHKNTTSVNRYFRQRSDFEKRKISETLQIGLSNKVYVTQEIRDNHGVISIKRPTEETVQLNFTGKFDNCIFNIQK